MVSGMTNKVYVWPFSTRLFHWLLAFFIVVTVITAQYKSLLIYHVAFGMSSFFLVVLRIVFGLLNVRYSRLKDFLHSFQDIKEYILHIRKANDNYTGHNPLAGIVMSLLMFIIIIAAISGIIHYGIEEGRGILHSLKQKYYYIMEFSGIIHTILSYTVIGLIFIHLAGVLLDKFLHKEKSSLYSIIHGYKNKSGENVKQNLFQLTYGYFWISISIFIALYIIIEPKNIFIKDSNKEISYKIENPSFYKECISCHTLYPPFLLPKESWVVLMKQLDNHFDTDASIDPDTEKAITDYLIANSAEKSTKESAYKIINSLREATYIAISKTPFWKKTHKKLDKNIFTSKDVKSKANCIVCHKDIESGKIENENIGFYPRNKEKLITKQ